MTQTSEDHIPKTLTEHNVQPGDVVKDNLGGRKWTIVYDDNGDLRKWNSYRGYGILVDLSFEPYTVLSRAQRPETAPAIDLSNPDCKTWGEMTDAEKGALLLAAHEGKEIEYFNVYEKWQACQSGSRVPFNDKRTAYRVKPEPKRETVKLYAGKNKPRIPIGTIELEDGKPVPGSEKYDMP